jgi:hypothetical protein
LASFCSLLNFPQRAKYASNVSAEFTFLMGSKDCFHFINAVLT